MKTKIVLIAILALWPFATVAIIRAQQPEQEQAKPVPQQTKPNKPETKPQEPKQEPGREMKPAGPQEEQRRTQQDQQKQVEEQQKREQQQGEQQKRAQEDARKAQEKQQREQMKRAEDETKHQNQHQTVSSPGSRPAAQRGVRIPEDRFRAHFGPEHHFQVQRIILIEDRPRFQYSGYWFELVDAWPVDWSYTDDCYVDYADDEYFLFSPLHPGVRIAVIVVG